MIDSTFVHQFEASKADRPKFHEKIYIGGHSGGHFDTIAPNEMPPPSADYGWLGGPSVLLGTSGPHIVRKQASFIKGLRCAPEVVGYDEIVICERRLDKTG